MGWSDLSSLPNVISLNPGGKTSFEIPIHVPFSASPEDEERLNILATSQANDNLADSAEIVVQVLVDQEPPIPDVTSLPKSEVNAQLAIAAIPTATDACTGSITGTTTDPLKYTESGTYTVTWTYTDSSGNESIQTQTVVVEDTILARNYPRSQSRCPLAPKS